MLFEDKKYKLVIVLILFLLILSQTGFIFAQNETTAEHPAETMQETPVAIEDLNKNIEDKRSEIEKIKEKIEIFEKNIQVEQAKTVTLQNQLSILKDQIYKNTLKIKVTENQLAEVNLEIKKTEQQIADIAKQIGNNHERLSEFIRMINKYDQQDFIKILVANDSFSDFFDQLNYLDDIQAQIQQVLSKYKQKKQEFQQYNLEQKNKKEELDTLGKKLLQQKEKLSEDEAGKNDLLDETKFSEKKFQKIVGELKAEQETVNSEIANLEAVIRKRLEELNKKNDNFDINKEAQLSWPVSPNRGISAYFHDPDYPFRYIFEHPAIDIRASQSTAIKAAESGYVARAKDNGYGYSYIMIIHGNGISTVYGHVSRIDVEQDSYVVKGQVIGISGGMPGTRGAGRLTTGPHLHFEVRKDGIPVNPLEYLP